MINITELGVNEIPVASFFSSHTHLCRRAVEELVELWETEHVHGRLEEHELVHQGVEAAVWEHIMGEVNVGDGNTGACELSSRERAKPRKRQTAKTPDSET